MICKKRRDTHLRGSRLFFTDFYVSNADDALSNPEALPDIAYLTDHKCDVIGS